jgi:L-lactate dehydrogenase
MMRDDERTVATVSVLTDEVEGVRDVALSLPRVVGAAGVARTLVPEIDDDEARGARAQREHPQGGGRRARRVTRQSPVAR